MRFFGIFMAGGLKQETADTTGKMKSFLFSMSTESECSRSITLFFMRVNMGEGYPESGRSATNLVTSPPSLWPKISSSP
jgi:hypothetical protein